MLQAFGATDSASSWTEVPRPDGNMLYYNCLTGLSQDDMPEILKTGQQSGVAAGSLAGEKAAQEASTESPPVPGFKADQHTASKGSSVSLHPPSHSVVKPAKEGSLSDWGIVAGRLGTSG